MDPAADVRAISAATRVSVAGEGSAIIAPT
jgi:hypothetical protein